MKDECYNIHNIVKFKIIKKNNFGLFSDKNPEYDCFRVDRVDEPDLILRIGKFEPDNSDCRIIGHKYHVKRNYFYCEDSVKNGNWKIEIKGIESGKMIVNLHGSLRGFRKIFGKPGLKNIFLRSILWLVILKKNYFLLHAAAVEKNGRGYVFLGGPGVFKTSLVMTLVRGHGFNFLGEENIILDGKSIFSYPFNLKSFCYKIGHFENENPANGLQKLKLALFVLAKKHVSNLNMSEKSELYSLFLLQKNGNCTEIHDIGKNDIVNEMVNNEKKEFDICPTHTLTKISENNFSRYIQIYSSVYKDSPLGQIWKNFENFLIKKLNCNNFYKITVPSKYKSEFVMEILNLIGES